MKKKLIFLTIVIFVILFGNIAFANLVELDLNIVNQVNNNEIEKEDKIYNNEDEQQDYAELNSDKNEIKIENNTSKINISGTKTIEEGIYRIATAIDNNIVVDIAGASKDNQANANLWEYKNEIQQKFKLEYDGNGAYIFRNLNSNKVLDVEWGGMTSGTNVWQYEYNGSDSQKWIIEENNDGSYNIISKLNGLYLDFENGTASNGINVQVLTKNNEQSQKFELLTIDEKVPEKTVDEGIYRIAIFNNKYIGLDIAGASKENQANVHLWHYQGEIQQTFEIIYDNFGYYKIKNVNSGKVLDVEWGGMTPGTNVWQYEDNNSDSQKWIIEKTDDGYYNIISKLNGLYLDIVNGSTENGTNVLVNEKTSSNSQKFQFISTDSIIGEKTINDGIYRIATALNTNSVIDIAGASTNNQANANLWEYKGQIQQKFKIEYDGTGYYKIKNVNSGKVLDVEWGGMTAGTNVWQYEDNGSDSQKWVIQETDDGYYYIISKLNGLYLDISNGSTENGTNVQVYEENNSIAQKFTFINKDIAEGSKTLDDGTYRIALAEDENAGIDVSNANRENGANIQVWNYDNVSQQQFNIYYDGNGYYTIIAVHSGKVMDIENGDNVNGSNVWQYTNNGSDAQKWVLKQNDDGTYNVISKVDSMYLDVSNGSTANGTNIQIFESNGSSAQKFRFIKISDKSEKAILDGNYRIALGYQNNIGLDVSNGSLDNQANVQLWEYTNALQQKFIIEYTEDNYYKIKNVRSDKVLDVEWGGMSAGTNVWQYEDNGSDSQKWIIRQTTDGHYNIISKLNGFCLDVANGEITNGANIQVYNINNSSAQKFDFIEVNIGIDIDESKYPGVKERVNEIVKNHPNWQFEVLYTGIDFYTAVQGEYEYDSRKANLVDTNVYKGDWIAPNPYVSGNWASASYNGIAYFMDTRNFLNDVDAFQFVDLADYYNSGATLDSIQYQVNGTFLNNFAEDVRISCEHQNVNPYYIIARLFQEQGRNGSITIYMDGGDGKQYFNPFNIGAQVGNDFATALAKAKEQGWDSMQKGIEGGITFVKQNYLDAKQNTLYLNKFDVNPNSPGGFYTHQYMQNLSAAYSEARTFRGAYVDTGTLDNTIKFIIPVYENMPETPAARPSGQTGGDTGYPSITDQGPKSVQVYDIQTSLIVRTGPGTQYAEIEGERLQNGTVLLSIERYENGWQRVITPSGTVGYCSGDYLQFINDVTNCNERVAISTTGSVNIRIGPGQSYTSLGTFRNGTTGTRILKDSYFADGYTWDLVILDDGTKGFVASQYLRII